MKKIIKSTLMLLCGVCMFTACSDDLSHNPTLLNPTTFALNQPSYSALNVDLATSNGLNFTWSQPNYGGFPVAAEYQMQFSLTNSFNVSVEQAEADETGATVADYVKLDQIYSSCQGTVDAAELAKGLQKLAQWPEGGVPATQKIYARLSSDFAGSVIYSNVVEFNVIPYYVELKDAPPVIWYLVGNCIADGSWGNSSIGKDLIPLLPIEGEEYDKASGTGKIAYTGYFPQGGQFKMVLTPGDWGTQMNYENVKDGAELVTDEDGDNHNIGIKAAGYYLITVDTKANNISIEAYTGAAKTFDSMAMPGSQNGWEPTADAMTALETFDGAENHVWFKELTLSEDCELKFTSNGNWDVNWGATAFPYGTGVSGGKNIPCTAGTYKVIFNDITGQYMFFE